LRRHNLKAHSPENVSSEEFGISAESPLELAPAENTVLIDGKHQTNKESNLKSNEPTPSSTSNLPANYFVAKKSPLDHLSSSTGSSPSERHVDDMFNITATMNPKAIKKRAEEFTAALTDRPVTQSVLFNDELRLKLIEDIRSNPGIDAALVENMEVPSAEVLSMYMTSMFINCMLYMPCVHEESFEVETAPLPLLLILLSYGCIYIHGESDFQRRTFLMVQQLLTPQVDKIWMLQAYILWLNVGAWSGQPRVVEIVMVKEAELLFLRQKLIAFTDFEEKPKDFLAWRDREDLARCIIATFTICSLVAHVYNVQISGPFRLDIPMPCPECIYHTPEAEWNEQMLEKSHPLTLHHFLGALLIEEEPPKFDFYHGDFICHTSIVCLAFQINRLRDLAVFDQELGLALRQKYSKGLDRWEVLRGSDYNFKIALGMEIQYGAPLAFNTIALLRLGYIMLASDFRTVGHAFMMSPDPEPIVKAIIASKPINRDEFSSRAARVSCQALRVPALFCSSSSSSNNGMWIWSVQHSVSYLHCAIFLSKWLLVLPADRSGMTDEENEILDFVIDTLSLDPNNQKEFGHLSLAAQVAAQWARLFAANGMWGIQFRISQALSIYSTKI
jgi:hypothetical protein